MGDNLESAPATEANKGSTSDKHVIYLTGFGPFGAHVINSSEAAVRLISESSLASELDVKLVTDILDVDYAKTQNLVPQQWDHYKPQLVVHVGVSGQAENLTLEQCAHNTGYQTRDILNSCPPQHCCIPGGNTELKSALPLESICEALNNQPSLRLKSCLSQDPGRYLCSFVYYTSLHRDQRRVVFVHVPPLEVCPAEAIAQTLKEAITLLYKAVTYTTVEAAAPGVAGGVPKPTSTSSTVGSSEEVSEKSRGCAGDSSDAGCAGKSSVSGCDGYSSSLNGSAKGENEKCGETEQFQGIEGRKNEETRKGLTHLNSAMLKMSTAGDYPLENSPRRDEPRKGALKNDAQCDC